MRRLDRERGASAVFTAFALIVIMGITALSVDVGALWWDKKELQNGADAAALAVAQSCANDEAGCTEDSSDGSLSSELTRDNKSDENAVVDAVVISGDSVAGSVTVHVSSGRSLFLAPVTGAASSEDVNASATASWGPIGSATVLPLAMSLCELEAYGVPSGEDEITFLISVETAEKCHPDGAVHEAPGGWGWLDPNSVTDCSVLVQAGSWAGSKTGKPIPNGCDDDLVGLQGQTVLLPVFDQTNGLTGDNAEFHLIGFAQLVVNAYCFENHVKYVRPGDPGCPANRWIIGRFVEMLELDADLGEADDPDFGARTVRLTG